MTTGRGLLAGRRSAAGGLFVRADYGQWAEESDDGRRFRAATSIPANIAEGRRQESEKEFARFLRYALNSSSELEYHLILAHDTKAISEDDFRSLVTQTIRVRKMLYALLKCLSVSDRTPPAADRAHKTARPKPTADPPSAPGR